MDNFFSFPLNGFLSNSLHWTCSSSKFSLHKMKWKSMILSAAMLAALTVTPANAPDYAIDSPSPGDFGTPTGDDSGPPTPP